MARVLITGPPGSGKTTIAQKVVHLLREDGHLLAGFVTREVRRSGRRTGFIVSGVGGLERRLAVEGGTGPRVGRYGVDVASFEEVAILELENGLEVDAVLIVDEIGPMELLSARFRELLPRVLATDRVLATVHEHDALLRDPAARIVRVTRENRDELAAELAVLVASA